MTYPNPTMAYDSCDYPGSPWKGWASKPRHGFALDLSKAVWVSGPMPEDAETARRAAVFLAMFPHMNRLSRP